MKTIQHLASLVVASTLLASTFQAQAEVVVVVGSKSPVASLTKAQVAEIYLGKMRDFPTGGAALTTILPPGPAKDEFFDKVLGKTDAQMRAVWARLTFTGSGTAPKELTDANEVKKLIANNPNVIGFIEKSAVDSQVKVVFAP